MVVDLSLLTFLTFFHLQYNPTIDENLKETMVQSMNNYCDQNRDACGITSKRRRYVSLDPQRTHSAPGTAETMTTLTKTELKNFIRFLNKFAIICTYLVCVMWPNCPGANVVGPALKFRKRKEN